MRIYIYIYTHIIRYARYHRYRRGYLRPSLLELDSNIYTYIERFEPAVSQSTVPSPPVRYTVGGQIDGDT